VFKNFLSVVNSLDTNGGQPVMQENNTGSNVADLQADYCLSQNLLVLESGKTTSQVIEEENNSR